MRIFFLAIAFNAGLTLASAQVQTIVVDDHPSGTPSTGDVLEKVIGHYDSTNQPSIIVGRGQFSGSAQGGVFLYHTTGDINGPWVRTTIDETGDFYERGVAYTAKGDTYPGIIISRNLETRWYMNPKNSGGDPYQPWTSYQVIANRPCHDMRLVDIDGDNNLDVVCSASSTRRTGSYISFFNSWNNWTEVDDPVDSGDGIAFVTDKGLPHIITSVNGRTYIWMNPRFYGGNARTGRWSSSSIADGDTENAIEGSVLNGSPVIYESANEDSWTHGLVMFQPTSSDLTQPWNMTIIASDFRAVHQLNAAIYPNGPDTYDANGKPNPPRYLNGVLAGEQEQACMSNPDGPPQHDPSLGCRVTFFNYVNGSFVETVLSLKGTQNQTLLSYNGGFAAAGANHGNYGGYPALQIWLFTPATSSSGGSGGTSSPPASGSIVVKSSGLCVEVTNSLTSSGATIDQGVCNGQPNQVWQFVSNGDQTYQIVNANSGLVMGIAGASTQQGALVIQWPWIGSLDQRWQATKNGNGTWSFVTSQSGQNLDVQGGTGATSPGAILQQWSGTGNTNQQFDIQ